MNSIKHLEEIKNRYEELIKWGYNPLDAGKLIIEEFNHHHGYEEDEQGIALLYYHEYILKLRGNYKIYKEI